MSDQVHEDIRATSENVIADAVAITRIEKRKLDPNVTDDELAKLSDRAAELAQDLAHKTVVEKHLVTVANAQGRLRRSAGRGKKDAPPAE